MKSFLYTLALLVWTTYSVTAQEKLSIADLAETSALTIDTAQQKITLQQGVDTKTFKIKKVDQEWQMADDQQAFFNALGIDSQNINIETNSKIDYLINLAAANKNQKLILEAGQNSNAITEELVTPTATTDTPTTTNWLLPTILGLVGIGVGTVIGMNIRKQPAKTSATLREAVQEKAMDTDSKSLVQLEQQIAALKKEKSDLTNTYKALQQQFQQYQQQDAQVNRIVFEKIILPLQNAINEGDKAQIGKLVFQAAIVLSSITRHKAEKKLGYDEHNIQILLHNASKEANHFETITKATAVDKTPKHIQVVISMLQDMGVTGLDEYIFQGYYLKNINA